MIKNEATGGNQKLDTIYENKKDKIAREQQKNNSKEPPQQDGKTYMT